MTKRDLADRLAAEAGLTYVEAARIVNALFFGVMAPGLVREGRIMISGFGSINVCERNGFNGYNPRNGTRIQVPARRIPTFRCSKDLKKALNPS